jgi:hypothetical protein
VTDKSDEWLDVHEAARRLDVDATTVVGWAVRYRIRTRRPRRREWLFLAADVDRVAREQEGRRRLKIPSAKEAGGQTAHRGYAHKYVGRGLTRCGLIVGGTSASGEPMCKVCWPQPDEQVYAGEIPWWEYDRRRIL